MNMKQITGAAKLALGRVQEVFGRVTGNSALQAAGLARQAQGRMLRAYGNVKEAMRNSRHS